MQVSKRVCSAVALAVAATFFSRKLNSQLSDTPTASASSDLPPTSQPALPTRPVQASVKPFL